MTHTDAHGGQLARRNGLAQGSLGGRLPGPRLLDVVLAAVLGRRGSSGRQQVRRRKDPSDPSLAEAMGQVSGRALADATVAMESHAQSVTEDGRE